MHPGGSCLVSRHEKGLGFVTKFLSIETLGVRFLATILLFLWVFRHQHEMQERFGMHICRSIRNDLIGSITERLPRLSYTWVNELVEGGQSKPSQNGVKERDEYRMKG